MLIAAVGCDRGERETRPAAARSAAATSQRSTAPSAAAASARPKVEAVPKVESLAPSVEPMPEDAAWDAVKEVAVTGSTERGCETKVVGEYLRVRCKNRNADQGRVTKKPS